MSNVLYRMKHSPQKVFDLAQEGFAVELASRTIQFEAMEDKYKAAIYKKLPEVESVLQLEALFAAYWYKEHKEKAEIVNLPQHLKMFSLPESVGGLTKPIHMVLGNAKQLKDETKPEYFAISVLDQPLNEVKKVPENIIEEFYNVAKYNVDIDVLPLLYAQHHYHLTGELFLKTNLLWIVQQVHFARKDVQAVKVPTGTSSYSTQVPRDSWGILGGLNSYIKSQIVKELDAPMIDWVTASNAPVHQGVRLIPEPAPYMRSYAENEFIQYLFEKVRPFGSVQGTIPFNIPVESLLACFMYEKFQKVPDHGLVVPDRKQLVTKLNAYHAMKYQQFLKGRANTPETQLEFFGQLKHPASSDAAIKRGNAYYIGTQSLSMDSDDIIF